MKIIIIGAGFCGSTLASELVKSNLAQLQVTLIGAADTFARGVAFGESRPEHLLNVPAANMGASASDHGEFADWLQLEEDARGGFQPRSRYGDYLYARLQGSVAASRTQFRHMAGTALAVKRGNAGFTVELDNGELLHGDAVVLATGTLPPRPLAAISAELATHPAYLNWPWQRPGIESIATDARLLIVGSGLTMVDVALSLRKRGHRGSIAVLSRHGLLPSTHLQPAPPRQPLSAAMAHAIENPNIRQWLQGFRAAVGAGADPRVVVDAMRPQLQALWRSLPEAEQARFLRHLRTHWDVLRHRLAPAVALELAELQRSGQLSVRAGRLLEARLAGDEIEVRWRARGRSSDTTSRHDVLLRATGFDSDVRASTQPLLQQLQHDRLISADPLRLGLRSDDQLTVLDPEGIPVAGLYCLGPLLRPGYWEITAVPELRVVTAELAERLLQKASAAS